MMQIALLNLLIDGEHLKTQVTLEQLPELARQVAEWRTSVEQVLAELKQPLSPEQSKAVEALMATVDALQGDLLPLRQQIQQKQKQLFKKNAAAQAYMSSGG
jgi:phage tail tube protein FII